MSGPLAPIVLFCYNRPDHLRQTVESLRMNTLAPQSELFVYSDGPKNKTDLPRVMEVRTYLTKITGFHAVHIQESDRNKGLAASVIEGVSHVLSHYPTAIVLEDDMLSTTDFLTFMNQALETYAGREDIFSVTGYTPPISFPASYPHAVFLAPRASSWGWGTWTHKWARADWKVEGLEELKNDAFRQEAFTRGGEDLWPMLVKQQRGIIDSWAIRWTYSQFIHRAYGLYPVRSKIRNIGTDGSGTNFTFKTAGYGQELTEGNVPMPPDLGLDDMMVRAFRNYYRLPFLLKIKNKVKYGI